MLSLLELGDELRIFGVVLEHFSVRRVQRLVGFLGLRAGVLVHFAAGPDDDPEKSSCLFAYAISVRDGAEGK